MNDFIQFLNENESKTAGKERLFSAGLCDEEARPSWTPLAEPKIVNDDEISEAEQRLGSSLPRGYRTFVQTLGPGMWADAMVPHPKSLYAFDEEVGDLCGFIALAYNVDGCGNYIAINPQGDNKEQIYLFNHDPFGYAVAADSFEQWIRAITQQKLSDPNGVQKYYSSLAPFTEVMLSPVSSKSKGEKGWWEFWK